MEQLTQFLTDVLLSEEVLAALLAGLGFIVMQAIRRGVAAFELATGIQIEEKHERLLHEAIMSGVESAMVHGPQEGIETIKAHAIAHARESVPDAIAALVPGETVLDTIAQRYVAQAMSRLRPG